MKYKKIIKNRNMTLKEIREIERWMDSVAEEGLKRWKIQKMK